MGYDAEREALYGQYQEVQERITLMSVLDLAETVRAEWPDAKYVALATTDQGDTYQRVSAVLAADWSVITDEPDIDDSATAGNLFADRAGSELWQAFCLDSNAPGRPQELPLIVDAVLDIDAVLAGVSPADFSTS
jgi:hypothetical protein